MVNFQQQAQGVDRNDPDQYRIGILNRYIAGEGGLKNQVRAYAGALRPDTARSAIANMSARSAQRQGLLSGIDSIAGQYGEETNLLKGEANQALESGVSNTRKNYNRRGLLYSGMREGGEQSVRGAVASNLASGMAGATRDYQNLMDSRKQALASLELQNRQQALEQANQAFEMTTRNNVARAQALQQLGEGVGYAAGSFMGGGSAGNKSGGHVEMSSGRSFGQRGM